MNNFEVIIGIEIHVELNTKTKMFSSAPITFAELPNSKASVVDLGYPGTLPVVNKQAVVKGIQLSKALKMDIDRELHFDRKHYFYPDLPKGFQITQDKRPIGSNGIVPIFVDGKWINIDVERAHLEEDTAKSIHDDAFTLLDFNRAGTPLIEIVSRPVMHSAKEAVAYIDAIRKVATALDISDAKMEEGSLRADVNISLRPFGQTHFNTKVEVKNLNSLSNVEKAIEQEIAHQSKAYLKGETVLMATKRFDEAKKDTVTMRVKMGAADYRFFPEPNIPIIKLEEDFIDAVQISELPWETEARLTSAGVDGEFIAQLINDKVKLEYFDKIDFADKSKLAKFYFAEIVSLANSRNISVPKLGIEPNQISTLLAKQESGEISGAHVKKIVPELINGAATVEQTIDKLGFKQISDESVLGAMVEKIVEANQEFIDNNKDRPERVSKFLLGLLMKESKGQANPVVATKLVEKAIGE